MGSLPQHLNLHQIRILYLLLMEKNVSRVALKSFTTPAKFPPMRFYQLWHERVHHAPEHKWLRDLISVRQRAGQQIRAYPRGRSLPAGQHRPIIFWKSET